MTRLLCFVLLTGSSLIGSAAEPPHGYDSPEAAVRAYAQAAATEDYDLLFAALTPEAQVQHLAMSVVTAIELHGDDADMQTILHRHIPPVPVVDGPRSEADAERRLMQAVWNVKDPLRLTKEIAARHHAILRPATDRILPVSDVTVEQEVAGPKAAEAVVIDRLELRDDSATATVTLPPLDGVRSPPQRMLFRKVDGRWYCDIDPE